MGDKVNKIQCGSDVKNTGICDCFVDFKLIVGAILVPKSLVLTEEQLADETVVATLKTLIHANKSGRIFPFMVFNGVTNNTADPTIFTSGYGEPEPVSEGDYNLVFNFRKGGLSLSNALRSFNGLTGKYNVLFVDKNNTLIGSKKNGGLAGIPLVTLYTYPFTIADGANPAQYRTQFAFHPEYFNENVAFAKYDTDVIMLQDLTGLENIVLTIADTEDGSGDDVIYTTTAAFDCGNDSVYDLLADELAVVSAWLGNLTAGGTVAPVAVAKDDAAGGWAVTFDEVISSFSLAAPSVLSVAPINVEGYESNVVKVA